MRRVVKWVGISLAGVLCLILLSLIIIYYYLRSGTLDAQNLPELEPFLQAFGVKLEHLGSVRIDLLRSIQIRDLKLRWRDAKLGEATVSVGHVDLRYALPALWSGNIKIDNITVENVDLRLQLHGESAPTQQDAMTWLQLDALLANPPWPLRVDSVQLKNINVEFAMTQGQDRHNHRWQLQQAEGAFYWQANAIRGRLQLYIDSPLRASYSPKESPEQGWSLDSAVKLTLHTSWDLVSSAGRWQLNRFAWQQDLTLAGLALRLRQNLGPLKRLDLQRSQWQLNVQANSKQDKNRSRQGIQALFPLTLSGDVTANTTGMEIHAQSQAPLAIQLKGGHASQFKFDGQWQPFGKQASTLNFTTQQDVSLAQARFTQFGQVLSLTDFAWRVNAQGGKRASAGLDLKMQSHTTAEQFTYTGANNAVYSQINSLQIAQPRMNVAATAHMDTLADALATLTVNIQPTLSGQQLQLQVSSADHAPSQNYQLQQYKLAADMVYDKGQVQFKTDFSLDQLRLAQSSHAVSINQHLEFSSDRQWRRIQANLHTELDQSPVFKVALQVDNAAQELAIQHSMQLNMTAKFKNWSPWVEIYRQIGAHQLAGQGQLHIRHGLRSLALGDFAHVGQWPVQGRGTMRLTQTQQAGAQPMLRVSGPLQLEYKLEKSQAMQASLKLTAAGIKMANAQRPIPLRVELDARFDWPLTRMQSTARVDLGAAPLLDFELSVRDQARRLQFDAIANLHTDPAWQTVWADLKALDSVGRLNARIKLAGSIAHTQASVFALTAKELGTLKTDINLDGRLSQSRTPVGTVLRLAEPVLWHQQLKGSLHSLVSTIQFNVPALQWADVLAINALKGSLHSELRPLAQPQRLALALAVDSLQWSWSGENPNTAADSGAAFIAEVPWDKLLTPFKLTLSASQYKERMVLDRLLLRDSHGILKLAASGFMTNDARKAELDASLAIKMDPNLLIHSTVTGSGAVYAPFHLTFLNDRATVAGEIQFKDLDLGLGPMQIIGLRGKLILEEELLITSVPVKFRYLLDTDPFQRVDYKRVQPYLENQQGLSVESIQLDAWRVGPGQASVSLKQNLFRLQGLNLDLFGGHLAGNLFVDARPGAWRIGLLSRLSGVDLRRLLAAESALKQSDFSPVSARSALLFDVNRRLLQGSIDIVQINRQQLLQFLEILDPQRADEQLAPLRTALRLGHPKWARFDMQRGLLDLEVALSVLPRPMRINGLPLTPLINLFAEEYLEQLKRIPLE